MQSPQSATATRLLNELRDQAAEHKKLERRGRALAQRSIATMRELEAFCRSMGIDVEQVPSERRERP